MHTTHLSSGGRYPVLRTVAILFMLGAAVAVLGGVYWVVQAQQMINVWDRIAWSGVAVAAAFFGALTSIGMAELIKLFIDIEHNTRVAAQGAGVPSVSSARVGSTVAGSVPGAVTVAGDGRNGGRSSQWLEGEETAEGALMRGH